MTLAVFSLIILNQANAAASDVVSRFTFSTPETFADAPPECMPEVKTGTTQALATGSGIVVTTTSGTTVHFDDTFDYRTDFPDGSYLIGSASGHFTFTAHGEVNEYTQTVVEPRTIYAADGTVVGYVIIHALIHVTYNATTGAVVSTIDRFFFTCR